MKKIFFTALFLFTLAGSMAGASLAHATAQDSAGITGVDAFSGAVQNSASNGTPTIIDTAASKTATPFGTGPTVDKQMGGIMNWIMTLFAWLVGVAAITLDNVMLYTVVKMGQYVSSISAIGVTWRIFRDIGNIMLIFGFIAAGVTTILDTEMYGFKKALPMLLVGAVFLNFSLFFAEAVIDTGNLFATQFYQQINAGDTAGAKDLGDISTEGISSKIMNQLGLANIYGQALTDKGVFNKGTPTLIAFMSIILFIITAFVLFSLAFVLVARFVFLLMLIIISPIGFAGWAIPKLSKVSHWWWENLFDQTITAPILLLLLYVALAVITDANFLGFGPSGYSKSWLGFIPQDGQTVTNFAGFAGILLSFLVAMGLLIMVVWASKRLGAWGGGWATASAGALSFGLTAWAGRSSLGWVSQRAGEGWRRSALSRAPVIGRAVSGVLNKGGSASFDLRGVKTFGGLGGIVPVGDAQKGGYVGWEKAKIKEREDYAKTLEQTTGKFWGVPYMPKEWTDEGKEEVAKANLKKVEEEQEKLDRALRGKEEALRDTQRREIDEFNNRIKDAQRELARLQENKSRGGTVSDEEMEQARQAADTIRGDRDKRIEKQKDDLLDLRNKNAADKKAQAKVVEKAKEEVQKAENAPALAYAGGITWGPGKLFNRNQKAAKAIEKKAKRSKTEKDLDELKNALKEEKGEGKKESPAPATTGGH